MGILGMGKPLSWFRKQLFCLRGKDLIDHRSQLLEKHLFQKIVPVMTMLFTGFLWPVPMTKHVWGFNTCSRLGREFWVPDVVKSHSQCCLPWPKPNSPGPKGNRNTLEKNDYKSHRKYLGSPQDVTILTSSHKKLAGKHSSGLAQRPAALKSTSYPQVCSSGSESIVLANNNEDCICDSTQKALKSTARLREPQKCPGDTRVCVLEEQVSRREMGPTFLPHKTWAVCSLPPDKKQCS